MKKSLDIIIPTYNRCVYLTENIQNLIKFIEILKVEDSVGIIVSDNCSDDNTRESLLKLINQTKVRIELYSQTHNIGGINNLVFLVGKSKADFLLLLGDDDYFDLGYLKKTLTYLNSDKQITTIIPNCYNTLTYKYRTPIGKDCIYRYPHSLKVCFFATQMSGLVFTRKGLYEKLNELGSRNMYLQIFCVAYSGQYGNTVHILDSPLKITIPEKRRWNYSKDMLLGDMFENLKMLNVPYLKRSYYEMYVVSYYAKSYCSLGMKKIFSIWSGIIGSNNLTIICKILYPLYLLLGIIRGGVRRIKYIANKNKSIFMHN